MLTALRRLFRRVPPHLAGRVPVDAGVGVARDDYRIGYGPEIRPVVLTIRGDLTTKPRVFTPAPPLPSGARPDWAVREADMERARIREAERARSRQASREVPTHDVGCDCTGCPHRWEPGCPPPNASEVDLRAWFAGRLERPKPAENAKRYTREDGTW